MNLELRRLALPTGAALLLSLAAGCGTVDRVGDNAIDRELHAEQRAGRVREAIVLGGAAAAMAMAMAGARLARSRWSDAPANSLRRRLSDGSTNDNDEVAGRQESPKADASVSTFSRSTSPVVLPQLDLASWMQHHTDWADRLNALLEAAMFPDRISEELLTRLEAPAPTSRRNDQADQASLQPKMRVLKELRFIADQLIPSLCAPDWSTFIDFCERFRSAFPKEQWIIPYELFALQQSGDAVVARKWAVAMSPRQWRLAGPNLVQALLGCVESLQPFGGDEAAFQALGAEDRLASAMSDASGNPSFFAAWADSWQALKDEYRRPTAAWDDMQDAADTGAPGAGHSAEETGHVE